MAGRRGGALYWETILTGYRILRDSIMDQIFVLSLLVVFALILQRFPIRLIGLQLAAVAWVVYSAVRTTGDYNLVAASYIIVGLLVSLRHVRLEPSRSLSATATTQRKAFKSAAASAVLTLTLLLSPFAVAFGSSNNIVGQSIFGLGSIGVLVATIWAKGSDEERHLNNWWRYVGFGLSLIAALAIAVQVVWLRRNYPYRTAPPLGWAQTEVLSAPPVLRGLRVTPAVKAHIEAVAALLQEQKLDPERTRILAMYRSPGTVLASGLESLGPPWMFDHLSDAAFNCKLIELALPEAPSQLVVVLHSDPRPELVRCLAEFGFRSPQGWWPLGCVPQTTAAESTLRRNAEACLFLTHRSE